MQTRIPGFDLARALAILGMFLVNFNLVFGRYEDPSALGAFLRLFSGHASTSFVVLAGMGVVLGTRRTARHPQHAALAVDAGQQGLLSALYAVERPHRTWLAELRWRALALLGLGLLLSLWWPADILHSYSAYLMLASLALVLRPGLWLMLALLSVLVFHGLLLVLPYEAGWDFDTLTYLDFWSLEGFLRSTLYNGWNPVFPWISYVLCGMYIGQLDWSKTQTANRVMAAGALMLLGTSALRHLALSLQQHPDWTLFWSADYLPPFLPFVLRTMGFALVLIAGCALLGSKQAHTVWLQALSATGRMTLTHYLAHLSLGLRLFYAITGNEGPGTGQTPEPPWIILLFCLAYFGLSVIFSLRWSARFAHGPLEALMRTFARQAVRLSSSRKTAST